MARFDDTELENPGGERESRRDARGLGLAIGLAVLAIAAAAAFYLLRRPAAPPERASAPAPEPAAATAATDAPATPPLDASDAFLRDLVRGLSSHPQLATWLVGDDLARRFVTSVVAIAEGKSPTTPLRELAPADRFLAHDSGGRLLADPASFRRYDTATEVLVSIDPEGAAEAYRRLRPLFEQAYREIGDPASSFDSTLARAIARLRGVPVPEEAELIDDGGVYRWADPQLEHRTAAEKQLLRFGPENALRVQAKLGELARALELPAA